MAQYDIAIIGGGPGGYVAAIRAAQMGKKTCIIEKNKLGGTCLNVGCIPTKIMLRSVEALKEIKDSANYGIVNIDTSKVSLDLKRIQERKKNIVNQLVNGINGLLRRNNVEIIKGEAKLLNKNKIQIADREIVAENIIIATGSKAKELPINIDQEANVLTSNQALDINEIPEKIVIIGGGVIGIEFAYFLRSMGTKVTIIEFLDRILPMVDREIADLVQKQLVDMKINIITGARVTDIKKDKLIFEKDGQVMEEDTGKVLLSVGRTPNVRGLNIKNIGLQVRNGAIVTNERLETNIPGIYAIGDVNGREMLAHTASMEAIVAIDNICGIDSKMSYNRVPNAIYIQPEIASVGLTEDEAKKSYRNIKVGRFPLMANGKAKVVGEERGFIKIISEGKYDEIVGVHMYCVNATDMISEATLAMNLESTVNELAMTIHPHPTISEIFFEACQLILDKPIHI